MRSAMVAVLIFSTACIELSEGDDDDATDSQPTETGRSANDDETPATEDSSGPIANCTPDYDCDPPPPDTGDPHADCVTRVNQFRACACMGPLVRNFEAESCADEQSEYDSNNQATSHAAFRARICSPGGSAQNECPGWRSVEDSIVGCIRQMYYEGPPEEDPCEGQCYQAHGHFLNMTDPSMRSVACGFFEADDGTWAIQNFFR